MKRLFFLNARILVYILMLNLILPFGFAEEVTEVLPATRTKVEVKNHPKTGKPYVTVVPDETFETKQIFQKAVLHHAMRPDYRMLDPKVSSKDVGYDGPYSDRRKIYYFAATLAAGGVLGGTLLPVAPAAAGAASGGAGAFAGAGTAVSGGTLAGTYYLTKRNPEDENYKHSQASSLLAEISPTLESKNGQQAHN